MTEEYHIGEEEEETYSNGLGVSYNSLEEDDAFEQFAEQNRQTLTSSTEAVFGDANTGNGAVESKSVGCPDRCADMSEENFNDYLKNHSPYPQAENYMLEHFRTVRERMRKCYIGCKKL